MKRKYFIVFKITFTTSELAQLVFFIVFYTLNSLEAA